MVAKRRSVGLGDDLGAMSRQNQQVLVMVWRRKRSESKMTAKFPTWGSERLVTPFSVMDNTEEKGSCWERW